MAIHHYIPNSFPAHGACLAERVGEMNEKSTLRVTSSGQTLDVDRPTVVLLAAQETRVLVPRVQALYR
jgi:hypothetical protein